MDMQMDALLEHLTGIAERQEGGAITAEQAQRLVVLLNGMSDRLEVYMELVSHQQVLMMKAVRMYKRYNGWPPQLDPDPARVLEWLLERSGRKQAMQLRDAMMDVHARLAEMGMLSFDSEYAVRGSFLIGLRMRVKNALFLFRIDQPDEKPDALPIRLLYDKNAVP